MSLLALVLGLWPGTALAARGPNGQEVTVSRSTGLNPVGTQVTVRGSGFDLNKGIYVAFCVNKGPGQMPSPCLGGVDMEGASGSSAWISSNPPAYGEGLAKPFTEAGGKGSFEVTLMIRAKDQFTDCLNTRTAPRGCVIGTRADHTRTADRSADVLIPVTFTGGSQSTPPSTPPTTAPTTTQPSNQPTSSQPTSSTKKGGGTLANTGGLAIGFAALAVLLVGVGSTLLVISRRRKQKEPAA